jgi:hypothetical protein
MLRFSWRWRLFELILSMISLSLRNFWWIFCRSCKISKIFESASNFVRSIIEEWFRFFSSLFWFHLVSRSSLDIWFRESRIRIYLCSFAVSHFSDVATSALHVWCVLFSNCYKLKCHLCMLIRNHRDNQRTRHLCNADTSLIHCIAWMRAFDIYTHRIWFEMLWDLSIRHLLCEFYERVDECSIWWSISSFLNASEFRQSEKVNICFFLSIDSIFYNQHRILMIHSSFSWT